MRIASLSEVKSRLSELAEEVATTHERVHVTRNGRQYVVLLAAEDFESLEETIELLGDPAAQERIQKSEQEVIQGDVFDEEAIRALLGNQKSAPG